MLLKIFPYVSICKDNYIQEEKNNIYILGWVNIK